MILLDDAEKSLNQDGSQKVILTPTEFLAVELSDGIMVTPVVEKTLIIYVAFC